MSIQYSFSKIAEQIIVFNNNLVDTLSRLNQLVTSTEPSLTVNVTDKSGVVTQFSLPSIGYLKAEIDRLSNNINAMYNIDNGGALIQTSSANRFRKVVTVNLNKEPSDLTSLQGITTFVSAKNWFFEGLMNPQVFIELDLTDRVDMSVRKVLSRRYIVQFMRAADGSLTAAGQSALNSFNSLYRNNPSVELSQFQTWLSTTPGVMGGGNTEYDEQMFDMEPNKLSFIGEFTVDSIEEDTINRKLWYRLDTIEYSDLTTGGVQSLKVDDELILNLPNSTTKYRIVELSSAEALYRVRLERTVGNEPVPTGRGVLKIYSPIMSDRKVRISVGYNERCVVFLKPINMDTFIMSRNWSLGTGFWTNDLRLTSNDTNNGLSLEQYYVNEVQDYGQALKDMVAKKVPNTLAITPNAPVLNDVNFKVVQINRHLTENSNTNELKNKNNQQKTLSSEIEQINDAINEKNRQLRVTRFTSEAAKKQFENEIERLIKTKETKTNSLNSITAEMLDLAAVTLNAEDYKFRVRGFWDVPNAVVSRGTKPQEVIQFIIEYRYLSTDGKETPVETFPLDGDTTRTAAFSNWNRILSEPRQRMVNMRTGEYSWMPQDTANPDAVNINQVDIPITLNERVEIRVKSISEVGWPESPVESDWSNTIAIDFPEELGTGLQQNQALITDANKEDIRAKIESDLQSKGLYTHLAENTTVNNKNFFHNSSSILSGFKDENGLVMDLYEYLQKLEQRVKFLEDEGRRIKGELEVVIFRNSEQFVVKNGTQISFTVECEDYLDQYDGSGVPTGRVYANNIYQVKDFMLKVRNKVANSPLGLFSNRTYVNTPNSDVFNSAAPQTFWVNDQNELIYSNLTGETKTQADNQFLWSVNFDSLNQTTTNKLSDNVGNGFIAANSNSVTPILSSTEFNLGYSENSVLSFVGNNNSLLDVSKWIDSTVSVASTTKLLSTIHPSTPRLQNIVETNADKKRSLDFGEANDINIPINIYFKMNALDPAQEGVNYRYIDLNVSRTTVRHTKKLRFLMESDTDNRPFVFTIQFILNRNKVVLNRLVNPGPNRTISTDMPTTFIP
jgi:hypothetical protein